MNNLKIISSYPSLLNWLEQCKSASSIFLDCQINDKVSHHGQRCEAIGLAGSSFVSATYQVGLQCMGWGGGCVCACMHTIWLVWLPNQSIKQLTMGCYCCDSGHKRSQNIISMQPLQSGLDSTGSHQRVVCGSWASWQRLSEQVHRREKRKRHRLVLRILTVSIYSAHMKACRVPAPKTASLWWRQDTTWASTDWPWPLTCVHEEKHPLLTAPSAWERSPALSWGRRDWQG